MSQPRDASWQPRLRPGVVLAPVSPGRWQARWDFDDVTFLNGEVCDVVLDWLPPLLDGSRTVADLQFAAVGRCQPTDVLAVLECLDQQRLLTDQSHATSELSRAFEALTPHQVPVAEPSDRMQVVVCGRSLLAERIVRAVNDQGMLASLSDLEAVGDRPPTTGRETSNPLPVVVETDWAPAAVERFNELAVARQVEWMLVGAWPRRVLVGPLFLPGETGCYCCYRQRLASHREYLEAYESLDRWQRTRAEPPDPQPLLPAIADLAAAWSALELLAALTGIRPCRIRGRTLVYQPDETRLSLETVLRIPWCAVCGSARRR